MKDSVIGGLVDNIWEDCIHDYDAVIEYLSNMSTVAWYNHNTFRHAEYDKDKRIIQHSGVIQYKT